MTEPAARLNAICPYFTMFPLAFPLGVLAARAKPSDWVLDPFAGRGTTNYAARLLGLPSIGVDSSPVAVALTEAKLANASAADVVDAATELLDGGTTPSEVPDGEFWSLAYHPDVLRDVCTLRSALIEDCRSDARMALRGVLLGALHGPMTRVAPSHLSNQCTRTFAPKPRYAVKFWRKRGLVPPRVDVRAVIRARAERYYVGQRAATGIVIAGDSREVSTFRPIRLHRTKWIITSPPFYGMRTYVPDQWLRNWFVGGPSEVDYSTSQQLGHASPESFAEQLRAVWTNCASIARGDVRLVVRFGGISDRKADPRHVLRESFRESPWRLTTINPAGSADMGKRQADQFATVPGVARAEFDAWARRY